MPGLTYSPVAQSNNRPLRSLQVVSYDDIAKKYNLKTARKYLRKHKVFPGVRGRRCWKCGSKVKMHGADARCNVKSCHIRIPNADVSYTPIWPSVSAGHECTELDVLKSAYVIGVKVPDDSARHIVGPWAQYPD